MRLVSGSHELLTAIPELDKEIGSVRRSVEEIAVQVGEFYGKEWTKAGMPTTDPNLTMTFCGRIRSQCTVWESVQG